MENIPNMVNMTLDELRKKILGINFKKVAQRINGKCSKNKWKISQTW